MAITWTRETVAYESTPSDGMTAQQLYNFFGALVADKKHSRWSNQEPYADWFVDRLNAAIALISAHVPPRIELISTTTVADTALYRLPDYAISTAHIRWIRYDGDNLNRISVLSAKYDEYDGVDDDSLDTSGTPAAYAQQGANVIRLLPPPDSAKTMKVLVATLPEKITAANMATAPIPLPAYLQEAPAYYIASMVLAFEGKTDIGDRYENRFWHVLNKRIDDDVSPVEGLDAPAPGYSVKMPSFGGDDI